MIMVFTLKDHKFLDIIVKICKILWFHEMDYKMFKLYLEFCHFDTWNKDEKVREAYAHYVEKGEIKYDNRKSTRASSKVSKRNR